MGALWGSIVERLIKVKDPIHNKRWHVPRGPRENNCLACEPDSRCQPPAGATPLLRFGLPSPPGVVGMVMAPGGASGKHPFYDVCKCGLGCCVCGGCGVGVGLWGRGLLVVLHMRALFVGGGGCVWVKCPCGGSWPPPWVLGVGLVLVLMAGGVAVRRCCCGMLLCFALL